MRVVVVSKTFVADTAQRQLEWIARQPDIDLTLITPSEWRSDDGRMLPFVPRFTEGWAYRTLPVLFNGRYHFYVYRGLRAAIRSLAPDLVHIDEEPYNPAAFQAQRTAATMHAPSVIVAWQNLYRNYPAPFARIEQYNYAHAGHIIAGNAGAADVVRRKGYSGPLSTFSVHGVDPDVYAPRPRERTDGTFLIGYIGRLVLYKGIGLLIEALAGLPDACRLRIIGSGPDEGELRRLAAERGVAGRVEFLPAIPTHRGASCPRRDGCARLALAHAAQLDRAVWPHTHRGDVLRRARGWLELRRDSKCRRRRGRRRPRRRRRGAARCAWASCAPTHGPRSTCAGRQDSSSRTIHPGAGRAKSRRGVSRNACWADGA